MKTSIPTDCSKEEIDIDPLGLVIFGDLDDYLVYDHVTMARKYVKNLQVRIVKGANHFVQQDDPDTVNRYMRDFLRSSQ
jgi:pimeloyl-ACP methyl ester carboxylesterase